MRSRVSLRRWRRRSLRSMRSLRLTFRALPLSVPRPERYADERRPYRKRVGGKRWMEHSRQIAAFTSSATAVAALLPLRSLTPPAISGR